MAEWQQFVQSVFFGVIFSFLIAKLFSVIFAFRDENLRISRSDSPESASKPAEETVTSLSRGLEESEPLIIETEGLREGSTLGDLTDSDDDWEGVESTELDEVFSAATAFVAATAADSVAQNVSNEVQLQLYGFYKIATEGPCSASQPSLLKPTARAKWQAWQKLGAMPPEEAMEKYIDIVTTLYPSWAMGSATKSRGEESSDVPNAGSRGPMGPVFSSFIYEEESGSELKLDAIHTFAREGDAEKLLKSIESGVPADLKDSEGRTPLHWAVDRGHINITELLLNKNADVNAKDDEGQTPLHYAVVCERAAIAELLVKNNADTKMKDKDGDSPCDLCESSWPWMQQASTSD